MKQQVTITSYSKPFAPLTSSRVVRPWIRTLPIWISSFAPSPSGTSASRKQQKADTAKQQKPTKFSQLVILFSKFAFFLMQVHVGFMLEWAQGKNEDGGPVKPKPHTTLDRFSEVRLRYGTSSSTQTRRAGKKRKTRHHKRSAIAAIDRKPRTDDLHPDDDVMGWTLRPSDELDKP